MQNKLIWKILAILILLVMLLSCATLSITADNNLTDTIYVPDDYAKIQWAVNKATAGDTIIVRDGTYTENIVVNKRLTIRSENGYATVQAANTSDHVFEVTADYVNISGFMVKKSSCAGISLKDRNHCNISNNKVSNNSCGISLENSSNNFIMNNIASNNARGGCVPLPAYPIIKPAIKLEKSYTLYPKPSEGPIIKPMEEPIIKLMKAPIIKPMEAPIVKLMEAPIIKPMEKSIIKPMKAPIIKPVEEPIKYGSGISLSDLSNNNTIINNTIKFNFLGINIQNSNNNNIRNNDASFNKYFGIYLYTSSLNNVTKNNNASANEYFGILLDSSDKNTITGNYANRTKNGIGIYLYNSSSENTIEDNTANNNSYDGIAIGKSSDDNEIRNNIASFNNESGTLLFSCNGNNVIDNNLSSNSFGLSLIELESGGNTNNNQIKDNDLKYSKNCGIILWDLRYPNNITDNNASNNSLFGIFVCNSTNLTIRFNKANFSERGIGLCESRDILLKNNIANSNKISGISLINSTKNRILDNYANLNIYEGIYLSNSTSNVISNNNVSSNKYFGISLYSSYNNTITNNIAESNYYSEIFLYNSPIENNTIDYKEPLIQVDEVHGVRLHLLTPSFQIIENGTNANYYIVVENLGNSRDTFNLSISSVDKPKILSLNKYNVSRDAGAGDFLTNTISDEVKLSQLTKIEVAKTNVETIKLTVGDTKPGIYRVTVTALSVNDTMVKDVIETRIIVTGNVSPVLLINSPKIYKSAIINSTINNSTINRSAIINSHITDSTITGSVIINSEIISTPLDNILMEDAKVISGNISSGNMTINEIKYEITNKTQIPLIRSDRRDSDLVGIKNKTLEINATKSNVSFDIYAKKDYFAGSLSVQKSEIPPEGIPECGNNVGGYVYANASDNLANSTDRLRIYIYYDPNELGDLNERSLRLRYFNETADAPGWGYIPISGVNPIENYVWGNISHFSTFALASVYGGRDGGIRHLPDEIIIDIANWGTNTFYLECLGHDITKVLIDLKSMKINAKMALKKVDKPAEFPDPPGIVYGYFDISTNIEPEKIRSSKIHFKVLKSWTVFNDVNVETIKLWRYANGWEELETAKIKEDDNYLHFYAETKCFSLIAITSEKRALDVTPTAPTPTAPAPTAPTTPAPTPPSESPEPPVDRAPISLTGRLIIIVAIVALAITVSVTYLVHRRRKT
ncbi:MAG: NosD domain-containing protein [Halobacteriota archaeon]